MLFSSFFNFSNKIAKNAATKYFSGQSAWLAVNPTDGEAFFSAYIMNIFVDDEAKDTQAWCSAFINAMGLDDVLDPKNTRLKLPTLMPEQRAVFASLKAGSIKMSWPVSSMELRVVTPRAKSIEECEPGEAYLEIALREFKLETQESIYRTFSTIDENEINALMAEVPALATVKSLAQVGEESRNRKKLAAKKAAKRAESLNRKQQTANEVVKVETESTPPTFSFLD